MLTLAVACSDIYGPEEVPVTPDTPAGVEITFSEVKDSSFVVTITPKDEASFYSYLVDIADAPEVLDAESLYKMKYSSIAQGTVKWSKEEPSFTFTVDEVIQDATYQVYAVAGSPMGIIGEVCTASVSTSDTHVPNLVDFEASEDTTAVALCFDEPVSCKKDITIKYYKRHTENYDIFYDVHAGTVTVAAADVIIEDDIAYLMFGGVPAGAYYTVSYEKGAFVDAKGNEVAEQLSYWYVDEDGYLAVEGLYGRAPFESFDVTPIEAESFAEYKPFVTGFDTENAVMVGGAVEDAVAIAEYVLGGKTVTIELAYGADYWLYKGNCVISLPEEPERGATVTVTIPAGTFVDEWGNSSNEFVMVSQYSYGYTLNDIIGEYAVSANSAFNGNPVSGDLVITTSDDEKKGNVMITSVFGIPAETPVYASFDGVTGVLTISSPQTFGLVEEGVYAAFGTSSNTAELIKTPTSFSVPESGVITYQDNYFGIYLFDATGTPMGWYDVVYNFYAARNQSEVAPSAVSSLVAWNPAE